MANVRTNTRGAISTLGQSAAIAKAGARPANRKAVAAPAICCIRNLPDHALDRRSVADLLTGTPFPRECHLIPDSDVRVMACRSCNSVTRCDEADSGRLAVNGSGGQRCQSRYPRFYGAGDRWIEKIGLAVRFGRRPA